MRRAMLLSIIVVGLQGLALYAIWSWWHGTGPIASVTTAGRERLEAWIGERLHAVVQTRLRPELRYGRFDFELPATAIFSDVELVSGGLSILSAPELRVALRETPRRDRPLIIDHVELVEPILTLQHQAGGSIIGFSDLFRAEEDRPATPAPGARVAIRTIRVRDGALSWTDRAGTTMQLDQLGFDLTSTPEVDTNLYRLAAAIKRPPLLDIEVEAKLDVVAMHLDIESLRGDIRLDRTDALPPAVQTFLGAHDAAGQATVALTAGVPMRDLRSTEARVNLEVRDGRVALGAFRYAASSAVTTFTLRERRVGVDRLAVTLWGGSVDATGWFDLDQPHAMQVELDARDVRIEQALRTPDSAWSGIATIQGAATGQLDGMPAGLTGNGDVSVRDASLMKNAVFGGLMRLLGRSVAERGRDRGSAAFELTPSQVRLTNVDLVGGVQAARGEGEITWDGGLNLRFNAGPLERMQRSFGAIGDIVGAVTDRIVTYQVTGTVSDPEFNARPLGIGVAPGR